jgi:hypothetical protein
MARARVESPKKKPAGVEVSTQDNLRAAGPAVLSPLEAAVACAGTRRTTIFMDMGVQYADDHEKEKDGEDDGE